MLNLSEFSLNHHPFGVKMGEKISDVEFRDNSILIDQFPFYGYRDLMTEIVALENPRPGLSVLDLGTGPATWQFPSPGLGVTCGAPISRSRCSPKPAKKSPPLTSLCTTFGPRSLRSSNAPSTASFRLTCSTTSSWTKRSASFAACCLSSSPADNSSSATSPSKIGPRSSRSKPRWAITGTMNITGWRISPSWF